MAAVARCCLTVMVFAPTSGAGSSCSSPRSALALNLISINERLWVTQTSFGIHLPILETKEPSIEVFRMSTAALAQDIATHLQSKSLRPTAAWLSTFVSADRPAVPLPALKQTALFRILASDFRQTLHALPESIFPADVLDANIQERRLSGPIPVQVVDLQDIGQSCWSQVEDLEAAERGETTKGREVIRVVPGDDPVGSNVDDRPRGAGPRKLTLQDGAGTTIFGIEVTTVPGIDDKLSIGGKLVLRNMTVARGVVLLEPASTTVLGGKIDALDKAWRQGRKEALMAASRSTT